MNEVVQTLLTSFAIPVATSIVTTLTTLYVKQKLEKRKWRREDYLAANASVASANAEVARWELQPHSLYQKGLAIKAVADAVVKAPSETSALLEQLLTLLRQDKPSLPEVNRVRSAVSATLRAENEASQQNQKPRRKKTKRAKY